MNIPETHLTLCENGEWQLIHRGIPCTKTTSFIDVMQAAKQFKLTPSNMAWSAHKGQFFKLEGLDEESCDK